MKASGTKWESEKHKRWVMPPEGFMGHVATDGSLLGSAGKWGACHWAVVQLDYDEEMAFACVCMDQWKQHLRSSEPTRGRT